MYQKILSRGKFLAIYYFVNFNLIVSKVNFFSWWVAGSSGRLFVAGHLVTFPT